MRPLEVRLTASESRRLHRVRDQARSPRLFKRAICLLRSAAGDPVRRIAAFTGLSPDAITRIRRRWRQHRLASLPDRPRCGRPSRITDRYRRELHRALQRGPLACGYVFTVWSVARLRSYLQQRTGIALSLPWLRQVIHQERFVVGRPKHTLKGQRNERQYRRARRQLARLKRGPCRRTQAMNSGMPTPASLNCCRTWSAAG